MMDDVERQLFDAERPEPGADVRARVLNATMPLVRSDDSRLDRVWFSPKWRMAAVLAVVVLAGLDAVSGQRSPWTPAAQDRAVAGDTARAVEMAAREAGLPPAGAAALVAQAIAATSASAVASLNVDRSVEGSNR